MDSKNLTFEFPDQTTRDLWPTIYGKITSLVKEPITAKSTISFEEQVRSILREHLNMELVKTDDLYRKFFKDILRFAINMHTDKMLYKIEAGRIQYRTTGTKEDNRKN